MTIMSRASFRLILACLHPDRGMSDEKMREAFAPFRRLESVLVKEEEPENTHTMPRQSTLEEVWAARAKRLRREEAARRGAATRKANAKAL